MESGVTIGDLVDASGTTHKTLWEGRYHGELPPANPGDGRRGSQRYSLCQVLAIRVARLLEKKLGVPPTDMRDLIGRLWNFSIAELAAEFEAGRICTVLINRRPSAILFPPEAVNDIDAHIRSCGLTAEVIALSIEREWTRVIERLTPEDLIPLAETN
jgi:hypothetical protein